jgi:hypothetical protein
MRRAFFTTAFLMMASALAVSVGNARYALAAGGDPEPPVTPFIDSGNDLPDLDARAREARAQQVREREAWPRKWYGWQIVLADLATAACIAGLQEGICLVPYIAAGPAIHLAHGHTGRFGASLGMRFGLPGLGGTIGFLLANCPDRSRAGDWDFCGLGNVAIGTLVGMGIAAGIDAAIAFTRVDPNTSPEPRGRPTPVIEPQLSFSHGGFNLGVGARF